MIVGKRKLKKVNAYSVIDSTGLVLAVETDIDKAYDRTRELTGGRVQLDQFTEEQLADLKREQTRRESCRPPPTSETRVAITSLTPLDGYDPLTMLSQAEVDLVVRNLRSLRLGTLPLVSDDELEVVK